MWDLKPACALPVPLSASLKPDPHPQLQAGGVLTVVATVSLLVYELRRQIQKLNQNKEINRLTMKAEERLVQVFILKLSKGSKSTENPELQAVTGRWRENRRQRNVSERVKLQE